MQNNALREEVSELRGAVEALGGERAPASGCVRLAPMPYFCAAPDESMGLRGATSAHNLNFTDVHRERA
jgi:hypothetical protein